MKKLITILFCLFCLSALTEDKVYVIGGMDDLGLNSLAAIESEKTSCVPKPPPQNPAQFSGGEGVPPLPLPAVPQRRTEKKNPPTPPVLIVKIDSGKQSDWNTNPSDTTNLLRWMAENMDVHFSSKNESLEQIFRQSKVY